jgi:two-component system sensor histidine kinase KdpD
MSYDQIEKTAYKIGKILLKPEASFDGKLQDIAYILAEHFNAGKCSIMIVSPDDLTLEVKASTNPAIIGLKRRLCDVSIATMALIEDEPFRSDEKRRSYFTPLDMSKYSSEHSISVPIKYLDKKLGVINLSDHGNNNPFTKTQEDAVRELTEYMAPYLYAAQSREMLEKKVKTFEETNNRLIEMDEMKTNLTGFIVHDLKGPISTIMANLDLLTYEPLDPQQLEYVNLAMEDIYKMQDMVMNILDVLKLEEGRIKIYREETDIYSLASREAASFKNLASRRSIELSVNGSPHFCYIDENLIGRVITNLLRNAIEHSPDGGKIAIELRYLEDKKRIMASVSDSGRGVPDDLKDKIFDKFFQIEDGGSRRKTSTGLGLTFCKLAVDAHGGDIRVEDSEEGGAKFTFSLPETLTEEKG